MNRAGKAGLPDQWWHPGLLIPIPTLQNAKNQSLCKKTWERGQIPLKVILILKGDHKWQWCCVWHLWSAPDINMVKVWDGDATLWRQTYSTGGSGEVHRLLKILLLFFLFVCFQKIKGLHWKNSTSNRELKINKSKDEKGSRKVIKDLP